MANRRERVQALAFTRRRLRAAFVAGDWTAVDDLPRRPNRMVYAGMAFVLIAGLAVGVRAYLSGAPPAGWRDDGTVVVDETTSTRYLSVEGVLRPVPNLTSAQLYRGSPATPQMVEHEVVADAPVGPEIGYRLAPASPPDVPDDPVSALACATGPTEIDVLLGSDVPTPQRLDEPAMLVRPAHDPAAVQLIADGRRHRIASTAVLNALSYTTADIVTVPRRWLRLIPKGPKLAPLTLPDPLVDASALPEIGPAGQVVVDAETNRHYVIDSSGLRPFANETSRLLAVASEPAIRMLHATVLSAPAGAPIGKPGYPDAPPPVATDAVGCVDHGGSTYAVSEVSTSGLREAFPPPELTPVQRAGRGTTTRVWSPPGEGVVAVATGASQVAAATGASQQISEQTPANLIANGVRYPLPAPDSLSALGYSQDQLQPMRSSWLELFAPGPALRTLRSVRQSEPPAP